jgi:hypothetical protein
MSAAITAAKTEHAAMKYIEDNASQSNERLDQCINSPRSMIVGHLLSFVMFVNA